MGGRKGPIRSIGWPFQAPTIFFVVKLTQVINFKLNQESSSPRRKNPGGKKKKVKYPKHKSKNSGFQHWNLQRPSTNKAWKTFVLELVLFYCLAEFWEICIRLNVISPILLAPWSCLKVWFYERLFPSLSFFILWHARDTV